MVILGVVGPALHLVPLASPDYLPIEDSSRETRVPLSATLLTDRGVVGVSGAEAGGFLQGIVTSDVANLQLGTARHGALLTPQGKILADFIVVATAQGFLLDVARKLVPDLVKRLGFYRLRAKVDIADRSADFTVAALWGGPPALTEGIVVADPRLAALGFRALLPAGNAAPLLESAGAIILAPAAYDAHRIALGVPEGGRDFAFADAFPHEADMDQLHGVDFAKGCYVGQEVVSRMQHRATARKRVVPVAIEGEAPPEGAEIRMGEVAIGTMGSSVAARGLALLRLDRLADAIAAGVPVMAGAARLRPIKPDWGSFDVPGAAS